MISDTSCCKMRTNSTDRWKKIFLLKFPEIYKILWPFEIFRSVQTWPFKISRSIQIWPLEISRSRSLQIWPFEISRIYKHDLSKFPYAYKYDLLKFPDVYIYGILKFPEAYKYDLSKFPDQKANKRDLLKFLEYTNVTSQYFQIQKLTNMTFWNFQKLINMTFRNF